jgi:predicted aspartyl protease
MSIACRSILLSALPLVAFCCLAEAADPAQPDPAQTVRVGFRMVDEFMIVVPVTINGAGPFNFIVDTGSSGTILDQRLADRLALPSIGKGTVLGVLGQAEASVVHAKAVSIGTGPARDMEVLVRAKLQGLPSDVRGILGEDFLGSFDMLIDNRQHTIQFETEPGALADSISGERLPIGMPEDLERPAKGKLLVAGRVGELGDRLAPLVLDSGTNSLVVFGSKDRFGACSPQRHYYGSGSTSGFSGDDAVLRTVRAVRFGSKVVSDLVAIVAARPVGFEMEGLVPTMLFRSVFISHSGGFVILDPVVKDAQRGM